MRRRGLLRFATVLIICSWASLAVAGGSINSGQTQSGVISTPSSIENWSFNGQAGQRVIFKAATTSGNLQPRLYLYPPGSSTAETDSGAITLLDYQLKNSGTYILAVQSFMQQNSGNYNLALLSGTLIE